MNTKLFINNDNFAFSFDTFLLMNIEEIEKIPMVFIVGVSRSGTTLLRSIISSGEAVVFPIESSLIIHLKKKYFHRTKWSEINIEEFLDDLYCDIKFAKYWNVEKKKLREYILSLPLNKLNFGLLIKIVYLSFSKDDGKTNKIQLIGDKNPVYSYFIDDLLEVFPTAKFVHILRDYRDCILSNRTTFKRKNVFSLAQMWKIHNRLIKSSMKDHQDKYLMIKYESLVTFPKSEIQRISQFININLEYELFNNQRQVEENLNKDLIKLANYTHPKLFKEIKPYNVGKWKSKLIELHKIQIAYILNKFGRDFGYEQLDAYKGEKFRFGSVVGFWVIMVDISIVKLYYFLPHRLRKIISRINQWIFNKSGFYTIYNQDNVLVEIYETRNLSEKKGNK